MKSIIQDKKECYICRTNYDVESSITLHEHHIFEGTSRRKLSEKYGLKVYLCPRHHNIGTSYSIHFRKDLDLSLKRIAQLKIEEIHTREEFISLFFKSYL